LLEGRNTCLEIGYRNLVKNLQQFNSVYEKGGEVRYINKFR